MWGPAAVTIDSSCLAEMSLWYLFGGSAARRQELKLRAPDLFVREIETFLLG